MHENHKEFINWASQYDTGSREMISKAMHDAWLKEIECEIIRYEGIVSTDEIIQDLTKRFTPMR